jgi:hypothetical protein
MNMRDEFEEGAKVLTLPTSVGRKLVNMDNVGTDDEAFDEGASELILPTSVGRALVSIDDVGTDDVGIDDEAFDEGASELILPTSVGRTLVSIDDVGTDDEAFVVGTMMPPLPVNDETKVLPDTVTIIAPLLTETLNAGVDAALVGLLVVEFTEDGGMSPEAPVEENVAVNVEVEKVAALDETVTFGNPDIELGGGIAPDKPVEVETAVDSPIETISMPEDVITVMFRVGVCMEVGALVDTFELGGGPTLDDVVLVAPVEDGGGINPSDPNELAVSVLLATEKFAFPKDTVSTIVTTPPLGVGLGGIRPFPPLLIVVALEPETVNNVEPPDTVTRSTEDVVGFDGIMPERPVELIVKVDPALVMTSGVPSVVVVVVVLRTGPGAVGGIMPDRPVELATKVDPETVRVCAPEDTEMLVEFTKTGGIAPLPPVESDTRVELDIETSVVLRVVVVVVVLGPGTDEAGGMSPDRPVEMAVKVDPETVKVCAPEVAETLVELTKRGGIAPLPPVESDTRVELDIETSVVLRVVVVVVVLGPGTDEAGGISPDRPVEMAV